MDNVTISKAANAGNVTIGRQTNYINSTDDSCLKDLHITNPEADKKRIESEKGGLLKDCYSWILYDESFKQWRDDPEQHLLWIIGDPGKGKTMLLAGLITELEKTSYSDIFYFFCQAAEPLLRTASNVLRGVIWLFVSKRPSLISYVRSKYKQASSNIFTDHNAWYTLSEILTAILEDETSTDCIIIIDALDECTEGREKLIGYISQCSISYRAKWVISSRNWPEIESQLDVTQNKVRLRLELNQASISNAVVKFVNIKVEGLNSTYDEPNRKRIRRHLLENARDTFLWVALVCQELGKPGIEYRHSEDILDLDRFPADLPELYARMINDINDRDMHWCRAILATVAVAWRPLSLQELAAADEALAKWVEDEKTLSSLVECCGSFLTIRENKVYTVHHSATNFLRKAPKILPDIGQQHYSIFNCSVKVMQEMLRRNLYELRDNCALIDDIPDLPTAPLAIAGYACIYWVDHFCEWPLTDDQDKNILCYAMITQFLEKRYLHWLEAMSLLRCTSEAIEAMQKLENKLRGRGPDELKLLAQDAVRFASKHRTIMDVAPLQLYDSALTFTPQLSKIKGCFDQEINKSIDVFSPNFQHWDACLHTIPGIAIHSEDSATCEFSPDGRHIATINSNKDSILLIDASTGGLVKSIESPGGVLHTFTFLPSGHSVVTLSSYTTIERKLSILHLSNGECSKSITFRDIFSPYLLSISLNGQLVAFASAGVSIWNPGSETIMSCYSTSDDIRYMSWIHIPSHPRALLILEGNDISIWRVDTWNQTSKIMSLTGINYPRAAMVSRDRTCCAVYSENELVLYSWGSSITLQKIPRLDPGQPICDLSWLGDDPSIALCGDFGIEVWDLNAKRLVAQVRGNSLTTICYGINGQLASLGFKNGTLKIWSLDTIMSHTEPIIPQSTSIVESFITSPSGNIAVNSHDGNSDMLSIVVDGRFHGSSKIIQNLPLWSHFTADFGHDDYLTVVTNESDVYVFTFKRDTGLYHCEYWIAGLAKKNYQAIQFWGQDQIIAYGNSIDFWDLNTGECLQRVSILSPYWNCISTRTADGRIAWVEGDSHVVIWDTMSRKETMRLDLHVLQLDLSERWKISLDSSGFVAISAVELNQCFVAIGNATDGSWIRKYSLPDGIPTLTFLTSKLLDTGFGVLVYDMERGSSRDIDMPTVTADDQWDPRYLRLSYTKSEAWLMRGSRRILWIPRQDVAPERFSIHTGLEAGKSTVTLVHDGCLFMLSIKIDSM